MKTSLKMGRNNPKRIQTSLDCKRKMTKVVKALFGSRLQYNLSGCNKFKN